MNSIPRLLHPVDEAASMLGIGRTSLYELVKRGDLEICKIGRRALIPDSSLQAFVRKLRTSVPAGD
jgi:excisionase family DNA binding protein